MEETSTQVVIEGRSRTGTGKGYARKLRKTGFVPANLCIKGKSEMIEIDNKWLSKAWLNGKTFQLNLSGKSQNVRIGELQLHPVKRLALHVDLFPIK
ncbi:MAG: hypothetical protein KBD78_10750 [Oligoflexales bacterium]|nr:hypothetical protein [Oligoflexales bacterium]